MARILSLEDCPVQLRNYILQLLRPDDEALLLPQAEVSSESNSFKNVVFTLVGDAPGVPCDLFNANWYTGVSAVKVRDADVHRLTTDEDFRAMAMKRLRDEIASEVSDSAVTVGPSLDCDASDRDTTNWVAGFDSPSCCVGLYTTEHSLPPEAGVRGQNRVHRQSFLICRAGGGLAASQFHSRLIATLRKGKSLEYALELSSEPGPQAFRRVSQSGSRNRAQILMQAADILGLQIDSIGDQASGNKRRNAVCSIDVNCNTLRRQSERVYYLNSGIDLTTSLGVCVPSNPGDGWTILLTPEGSTKTVVTNEACNSLPFASRRICTSREVVQRIAAKIKAKKTREGSAHFDSQFILERFVWSNRDFGEMSQDIEPLALWGTHDQEEFVSRYSRELGISKFVSVKLHPELVCLAGVDAGRLRGLVRNVAEA